MARSGVYILSRVAQTSIMNINRHKRFPQIVLTLLLSAPAAFIGASGHRGQVRFGGVPVPGVSVKAVQGDRAIQTTTDADAHFSFHEPAAGKWTSQAMLAALATTR